MVLGELQVVHHALNAVGDLAAAVHLQEGDDALLILCALRLLAEEALGQEVLEALNEDVLINDVRE